jgi:putative spermidine/putrescine transport system substrate-binding protein
MRKKGFLYQVTLLFMLPVFVLSACSSPQAAPGSIQQEATSENIVPISTTIPSASTTIPSTPTMLPPTATALIPTATAAPTATSTPSGEGELTVLAALYQVERGFLPWVEDFTEKTGCKVALEDFVSYGAAQTLIQSGRIDIVIAGLSSGQLMADDLVEEINIEQVPSWNSIDPLLRTASWNSVDGKFYGVPYLWVPNVLMYNTEVFPTPPTSWDVVFEEQIFPDGRTNRQRVLAPRQASYIADAAMYLMYTNPILEITNPIELSEEQFSSSMELLRQQQQILSAYWDLAGPMEDFTDQGYVVSVANPRLVRQMIETGNPISSTIPQEGATALTFTNMLAKDLPHPVCAYQWLEYSIDAKVQGDTSAHFGSNPSVPAACEETGIALSSEDCKRNGVNRINEFHFLQTPRSECENGQKTCVPVERWAAAFSELVNP